MSKRLSIAIVAAVIICGVIIKYAFFDSDEQSNGPKIPPVFVQIATAQEQQWMDEIDATGTISAFKGAIIKPQVAGEITKISFKDGSMVKKGDPLVTIYPDILEAQLQQDIAAQKLAQLEYDRGQELYKKRVMSEQDLDRLTSTLDQAIAVTEQTKAQLDQRNITAPYDGKVGLRQVNEGAYVNAGQAIVSLQQLDPIRIEFTVPEVYLDEIQQGQKVTVTPSSQPDTPYTGQVYAMDSAINPNTRAIAVRAQVPNKDNKLLPGLFAEVTLFAGKPKPVVVIPQTAVNYSPQGDYVYIVSDDKKKAAKTTVKLGTRRGNLINVTSGLKAGDVIVSAGQMKFTSDVAPIIVLSKDTMRKMKSMPEAQRDKIMNQLKAQGGGDLSSIIDEQTKDQPKTDTKSDKKADKKSDNKAGNQPDNQSEQASDKASDKTSDSQKPVEK